MKHPVDPMSCWTPSWGCFRWEEIPLTMMTPNSPLIDPRVSTIIHPLSRNAGRSMPRMLKSVIDPMASAAMPSPARIPLVGAF